VVVLHHTHVIVALRQGCLSLDVEAVGVPCTTKGTSGPHQIIKPTLLCRSQTAKAEYYDDPSSNNGHHKAKATVQKPGSANEVM